ncbi:MAG: TlpA family protein disulfide reductase [Deltaproteobacteria bacterium]|nr:TlpA family protein disulfide reductase [Deltaproteobacteria bacterium]MBI3296498.1 TlpA family protein disulfide reductase [Deltaproteobacteria bacterium]
MRAIALILLCGLAWAKPAPLFQGDKLGGGRLSLKEALKPDRHLLLSFWATWCVGCIEELKTVTARLKEHPGMPLDVLTVNVDLPETTTDVKPTMRLYGFGFPVVLDPKHDIFSKYQADKSLPYSVLISPTGEVVQDFQGYSEQLFEKISQLKKP